MSVDGNAACFPSNFQVARDALHLLPDVTIVEVQNHLARQAFNADEVRDVGFCAVRRRGAGVSAGRCR